MPTNNQSYNECLKKWAESGHPTTPECEECEADLTGRNVIETHVNWLCEECAAEWDDDRIDDREDFRADHAIGVVDYRED